MPLATTRYLYKVDHIQIHIGLAYLLMKALDLPFSLIGSKLWYSIVVINEHSGIVNISTSLHAIGVACMFFLSADMIRRSCFLLGMFIASRGYKGCNISGKGASDNTYTPWDESSKCMWHGGMSVLMTLVIDEFVVCS